MTDLGPEQDKHLLQGALGLVLPGRIGRGDQGGVLQILDDPARKILRRGDHVGQAGVDGAARHAVELGRSRGLYKNHPGLLLDGPKAQGAVRAHARQDDPDAASLAVIGQGAEEKIDWQAQAPRGCRFKQVQHSVQDRHVLVGRNHIDVVRSDFLAVPHLGDRNAGGALEQLHQDALVGRVQMLDDDKGHAASIRHMLQKQLQSLKSSGRGTDADNGKHDPCSRVLRCRGHGRRRSFLPHLPARWFFHDRHPITVEGSGMRVTLCKTGSFRYRLDQESIGSH